MKKSMNIKKNPKDTKMFFFKIKHKIYLRLNQLQPIRCQGLSDEHKNVENMSRRKRQLIIINWIHLKFNVTWVSRLKATLELRISIIGQLTMKSR